MEPCSDICYLCRITSESENEPYLGYGGGRSYDIPQPTAGITVSCPLGGNKSIIYQATTLEY